MTKRIGTKKKGNEKYNFITSHLHLLILFEIFYVKEKKKFYNNNKNQRMEKLSHDYCLIIKFI